MVRCDALPHSPMFNLKPTFIFLEERIGSLLLILTVAYQLAVWMNGKKTPMTNNSNHHQHHVWQDLLQWHITTNSKGH